MYVACWSVKGGSGTSVVAASLSFVLADRVRGAALLVDLAGDQPAVLGLGEVPTEGAADWLAAVDVPTEALAHLEVGVTGDVRLLGRGSAPLGPPDRLVDALHTDPRPVIVDCGTLPPGSTSPALEVAASATHSLLVIRPCYLALRRALDASVRPSAVVLVNEAGRSLDAGDVEDVLDVPVVADVAVEPAVARAVDAGLLASRLPRRLARALRDAA